MDRPASCTSFSRQLLFESPDDEPEDVDIAFPDLLLRGLPGVTHLRLSIDCRRGACCLLSFAADGQRLCPSLSKLYIWIDDLQDDDKVERTLSSRFHRSDGFRARIVLQGRQYYAEELGNDRATFKSNTGLQRWVAAGRLGIEDAPNGPMWSDDETVGWRCMESEHDLLLSNYFWLDVLYAVCAIA